MEYINKQFLLDKRPSGMPEDSCWKLNEEVITSIQNNEIIVTNACCLPDRLPGGHLTAP